MKKSIVHKFDRKDISILLVTFLMVNMVISLPFLWSNRPQTDGTADAETSLDFEVSNGFDELPDEIKPAVSDLLNPDNPLFPDDVDIGKVLNDRQNEYNTIFEPWRSKAAVHAIAYDEATGFLAVGGGYLYDNEVHIYRQNVETGKFDKVWDAGSDLIQSDVMCLDFGDTDLNDFLEIIVGSSDGHIYVFEQNHIYDPYTNTENMFEHVWTSESHFRVFALKVDDVDRDYRPDIVAGTWDGLFLYEYDNHSNYPFNEEHWITYRQVYAYPMDEKIYSLETGDTNYNGLPEIVVGTRSGTIYVFENDGLVTYLNGQPFPLISDNHYKLTWTSENYTWTPIISMDIGELDGDPTPELAVVAQGQGLFLLQWNAGRRTYDYTKIGREYKEWETFGYWGLDYFVDRVISANNVTYHDPVNASLTVEEPIEYVWNGGLGIFLPDADAYPYNTGMAGPPDGNYTTFDASPADIDNATAVVDFGLDEEGTGSANSDADVFIEFASNVPADIGENFNFSISQNGADFVQIDPAHFTRLFNMLMVDVDSELHSRSWDWFRYAKISVFNNASYQINSLELANVYNLLTDALSVEIGPMRTSGDKFISGQTELDKILVGTVYGKYIVVGYDDGLNQYQIMWDSGEDDRYKMQTGVWDMVHIDSQTDIPIFKKSALETAYPYTPTPTVFTSWAVVDLDPYGYAGEGRNILYGTKSGEILIRNAYGISESTADAHIAPINAEIDPVKWPYTSVEPLPMPAPYLSPGLAVGLYNPDVDPVSSNLNERSATILFAYRSNPTLDFDPTGMVYLESCDTNGALTTLLRTAKTLPKMKFTDYDGDGDFDMILSIGQLYLAKNEYFELGDVNFTLVPGYFDEINAEVNSYGWGQPDTMDLNHDGTQDLLVNYAYKTGATVFLNYGTDQNPDWEQDKSILTNYNPDTNIKLMNLTDGRFIPSGEGYFPDDLYQLAGMEFEQDYHLLFYNNNTGKFFWSEPEYNAIDSYLVATYPTVARMDFSLVGLDDGSLTNIGFHVRESWNNEFDLQDWTLSITSADTDGDGKGELIVGDYDNNMYAFENLLNNTYKRMYQSPDLIHEENSTESPYLYEQLEGISGNFIRRIWDHAEFLLADVDLDGDGLKEVLVATDMQIHVFEDAGLFGGDLMNYVATVDLRLSSFNGAYGWDELESETITALSYGNDLDYNGYSELIVAAGPYLFVLNIEEDNYAHCLEDGYFVTNNILEGRYALLGNPAGGTDYKYAVINALTTGDTDEDGYREIILGGILDKRYENQEGFVYIYECQGGTFYKAWEAPSEVTFWNPITTLEVDDQDYDSAAEIIIGHSNGVDIWEWQVGTDNQYKKVEHITSNPNYPYIRAKSMDIFSGYNFYYDPGYQALAKGKGPYEGYIFAVYTNTSLSSMDSTLNFKFYYESIDQWTGGIELVTDKSYMSNIKREIEPCIISLDDGDLYVAWRAVDNTGQSQIWALQFDYDGGGWQTPVALTGLTSSHRTHPSLFEYSPTTIGVLYTQSNTLKYFFKPRDLSGFSLVFDLPYPEYQSYTVQSGNIERLPSGDFALAMSAQNALISKPDYDIWTLLIPNDFNFTKVVPHQATTSPIDEVNPDISYLEDPEDGLVVVYENNGESYEKRYGIVASTNKGFAWKSQHYLSSLHEEIRRVENPGSDTVVWEYFDGTNWNALTGINAPMLSSPAITALSGEGFMYTFTQTFSFAYTINDNLKNIHFGKPYYGLNNQSDWIFNDLGAVVDLDVGDTDNDGRREIAVGWGHQAAVYEMNSSTDGNGFMEFTQEWLSDPFENEFTGITVYDTNGNGWEEIGISTRRGDVYLLEYPNPQRGELQMVQSQELWSKDVGIYAEPKNMLWYDCDDDGIDEMIFLDQLSGRIKMLDENGDQVWSFLYGGGYSRSPILADINNDSVPEILFAKENSYLYVLDLKTGSQMWNYSNFGGSGGGDIEAIVVGDIDNSSMPEVLYTDNAGWLTVLDYQGNFTAEYDLNDGGSGSVYSAALGYFMTTTNLSLAYGNSQGILRVINPLNGTILYESPTDIISNIGSMAVPPIIPVDFDDDGLDEIIIGDDRLRMVDPADNAIIYNSTYYGEVRYNMILDNFDNDDGQEIMVQTTDNGIFMFDIEGRQTKWHYKPNAGTIYDISIGHLQEDEGFDVALATSLGYVIAVDGLTGNMIWFNYTGDQYEGIACLSKSDSNMSFPTVWDNTGLIHQFGSYRLNWSESSPAFIERALDYAVDVKTDDITLWSKDINADGIDELIWLADDTYLVVWDYIKRESIWEHQFEEKVEFIRFGNLNQDDPDLEIVAVLQSGMVQWFEVLKDEMLQELKPTEYYTAKEVIAANFDDNYAGDELAILYEKSEGADNAMIEWYDSLGKLLHRSANNYTNLGVKMVPIHYSDLQLFDVATAGYFGYVDVFNGKTGVRSHHISYGSSVYELIAGDFDGNGYSELVTSNSIDTLVGWDLIGGGTFLNLAFGTGNVIQMEMADIFQNDSRQELIVIQDEVGAVAYESSASSINDYKWIYHAPLIIGGKHSQMMIADHNHDGILDLSFKNYNYWNVIDGKTERLLWHYQADTLLEDFTPGIFDEKGEMMGMAYREGNTVNFISYKPTEIPMGGQGGDNPALIIGLNQADLLVLSAVIPALMGVVIISLRKSRKKRIL